jgi:hypothetical protein
MSFTQVQNDVDRTRANLDKAIADVDSKPLLQYELEHFASLSQRELSKLFYGPDSDGVCEFAVRYRTACELFGFFIPPKFGNQEVVDSGEI